MHFITLALTALLASAAAAQPRPDQTEVQTFRFTHVPDAMAYKEIVTTLKQVSRVSPELPVDPASGVLSVSGTKDELAQAAWIVEKLDSADAPDRAFHQDAVSEKPFSAANGDLVEIFYLPSREKPRDLQEMITTLRQVGKVNRLFNYTSRSAIIFDAPNDQAKLAEWLIRSMQNPVSASAADQDFRIPDAVDGYVRVLRFNGALSRDDAQQVTTMIRRKAEISKIFTCYATHAIGIRGTAAQLAMASDLVTNYQPSH